MEINRDFKRDKKWIYREINEVYQNYFLIAKRIHVSLLIIFRKKKKKIIQANIIKSSNDRIRSSCFYPMTQCDGRGRQAESEST